MGTKTLAPRVVIDTNVLVSAFLFHGVYACLPPLWQQRKILPLLSRPVLDELLRVLTYPKFQLTDQDIQFLVEEEWLPYVEVIPDKPIKVPRLKDRDDEKFLCLALLGQADYLVSGDQELLDLKNIENVRIVSPADFLRLFDRTDF